MSFLDRLNNSVNLIAFALVLCAMGFVHMGRADIGSNLVSGAIGLIGGKHLQESANNGKPAA